MNTKLLMLGILIITGLSFAEAPPNWMEYAVNRYGCNYYYNWNGWDSLTGLWRLVGNYDGSCEYWGCTDMGIDLDAMNRAVWDKEEDKMCYHSGCWYEGEGTSTTDFRSSMLEYNVAAVDFKSHFLFGLRAYLAENPEDRSDILADLQDSKADYRDCLADSTSSCYICEK